MNRGLQPLRQPIQLPFAKAHFGRDGYLQLLQRQFFPWNGTVVSHDQQDPVFLLLR